MKKILSVFLLSIVALVVTAANVQAAEGDIELYPYDKIECLQALDTCTNYKVGDAHWDLSYDGYNYNFVNGSVRYASDFDDANSDGFIDATEMPATSWGSFGEMIFNNTMSEVEITTVNARTDFSGNVVNRIYTYFDENGVLQMFEDHHVNRFDLFDDAGTWRFATQAEIDAVGAQEAVVDAAQAALQTLIDDGAEQSAIDAQQAIVDAEQVTLDALLVTTRLNVPIRLKLDDVDTRGYVMEPLKWLGWNAEGTDGEAPENQSAIIAGDPNNVVIPAGWTVVSFGSLDRDGTNAKTLEFVTGLVDAMLADPATNPAEFVYEDQPAWFTGITALDDDPATPGTNIVVDFNSSFFMPLTVGAKWNDMLDESGNIINEFPMLDFSVELWDDSGLLETIDYTYTAGELCTAADEAAAVAAAAAEAAAQAAYDAAVLAEVTPQADYDAAVAAEAAAQAAYDAAVAAEAAAQAAHDAAVAAETDAQAAYDATVAAQTAADAAYTAAMTAQGNAQTAYETALDDLSTLIASGTATAQEIDDAIAASNDAYLVKVHADEDLADAQAVKDAADAAEDAALVVLTDAQAAEDAALVVLTDATAAIAPLMTALTDAQAVTATELADLEAAQAVTAAAMTDLTDAQDEVDMYLDAEGNPCVEGAEKPSLVDYTISGEQTVIDTSVFGKGYTARFVVTTPEGEETEAFADIVVGVMPPRFAGIEDRYADEDVMIDLLGDITADDGYGNDKTDSIMITYPEEFNPYNPQPGSYQIDLEFVHKFTFEAPNSTVTIDGTTTDWDEASFNSITAHGDAVYNYAIFTDSAMAQAVSWAWGSVMVLVGADGLVDGVYDRYTWDIDDETGKWVGDSTVFANWKDNLAIEPGGFVIMSHGSVKSPPLRALEYNSPVSFYNAGLDLITIDGAALPWDAAMLNSVEAHTQATTQYAIFTNSTMAQNVSWAWGSVMVLVGADGKVDAIYDRYTWDVDDETGSWNDGGSTFTTWKESIAIEPGGFVVLSHGSNISPALRALSYDSPLTFSLGLHDLDIDIITQDSYMLTIDDKTAPVGIVVNDNYMIQAGMYTDIDDAILANVVAIDNFDGIDDLAIYVSDNGGLMLDTVGTYAVEVTVEDEAGNAAMVEFDVEVVAAPVILSQAEVDAMIEAAILDATADLFDEDEVQDLIDDALADALTEADVQALIDAALPEEETGCKSSLAIGSSLVGIFALFGGAGLFFIRRKR